ncbi:hypothetical protein GCM10027447_29900 [Glycomyces halotolerans]
MMVTPVRVVSSAVAAPAMGRAAAAAATVKPAVVAKASTRFLLGLGDDIVVSFWGI